MRYEVSITIAAARDLAEIRAFLIDSDSGVRAEQVLNALQEIISTLSDMPRSGNIPKELSLIGATDYRELHYQSYRAIYTIEGDTVSIVAVADGRRGMQSFLHRRLVR